jgi:hypothetical protein
MARVVEFFGPIGGGKTTVCQELMGALAKNGISAVHRLQIRRDVLERRQIDAVLCRRVLPILYRRHIRFVCEVESSGDADFRQRVRYDVMMGLYSKLFLRAQVALFDHLIFQKFIGLSLRSAVEPEKLADSYLGTAPQSRLIVHLDTPEELAVERVFARKKIPGVLKRLPKPEQVAAVVKSARASRELAQKALEKGFPVVRCDGEEIAAKNAVDIMQHLVRHHALAPASI